MASDNEGDDQKQITMRWQPCNRNRQGTSKPWVNLVGYLEVGLLPRQSSCDEAGHLVTLDSPRGVPHRGLLSHSTSINSSVHAMGYLALVPQGISKLKWERIASKLHEAKKGLWLPITLLEHSIVHIQLQLTTHLQLHHKHDHLITLLAAGDSFAQRLPI